MAESEKIKGIAVTQIFEELLHRKTLLKLLLVDTEYEHLTLITALVNRKTGPHFIIDAPAGFEQAAAKIDPWSIRFEFTGKDRIEYAFTTIGGEIADSQIYVKLPKEVERKQRRQLFRLRAPAGTKLCLTRHAARHEMEVINISIGGSLAALVQTNSQMPEYQPFADKNILNNVELVFPSEILRQPIRIKTVLKKRMKKNPTTARCEVALEFYEISKKEKERLTRLIYQLQRQYLRQRLPLDI
jgi:c-di-GMP-binding flagellar brake protein YcgR